MSNLVELQENHYVLAKDVKEVLAHDGVMFVGMSNDTVHEITPKGNETVSWLINALVRRIKGAKA